MKKIFCLAVSLLALNLTPVFGQAAPPPSALTPEQQIILEQARRALNSAANSASPPNFPRRFQPDANADKPALTKFNLDFPGGTPKELVAAIEKAMNKPLNAIIPDEDADIQLPPVKMSEVVTPKLFDALQLASRKTVAVQNGRFNSYSQVSTDYGFTTADSPISDNSIWYFRAEKPSLPPVVSNDKVCKFYSLEPYLDHGLTVDDITTAIQTGWKMMGDASPPELNYHKETKLLIAYGEPDKLEVIDNVLNTVETSDYKPAPTIDPATGLPLPPIKPKAEKSGK